MADLIRYDLLVQDALRGVVRQVLTEVARNGLQGEHHFFIAFKTATPGLRLSNRMRERYPDEMTVILQHQFWGLTVTDAGFEVGLSFNNAPERLFVPFTAITMFQDPSVNFGLKFDAKESADAAEGGPKPLASDAPKGQGGKRALTTVASAEPSVPARIGLESVPKQDDRPKPDRAGEGPAKTKPVLTKVSDKTAEDAGDRASGPKVVSIDAFRKKPWHGRPLASGTIMGDVVNLRRFRKARKRAEAATEADRARLDHGRSRAERDAAATERGLTEARLDAHRRDPPSTAGERGD